MQIENSASSKIKAPDKQELAQLPAPDKQELAQSRANHEQHVLYTNSNLGCACKIDNLDICIYDMNGHFSCVYTTGCFTRFDV